ncbi:MAG: FprA family A-type flavoprotein [Paramuribaculum sp.]|nr:FprA family A-type flavoprotein [Paramuribaculum sp.]
MTLHISSSIRCVGVNDSHTTLFESQYPLPHGMSYNSYLILDQHPAITDTVDSHSIDQWLIHLDHELAGKEPEYLIVHHMEPDHTAGIKALMTRYPKLTIVASAAAIKMLPQFCSGLTFEGRTQTIREGDSLNLGTHTLQFFAAPMVHWPEVMVSYETHEKVLFSADAFGKFGVADYPDNWTDEARRYYFNIVGKYGPQVTSLLNKLENIETNTIAPLHGPLLRNDLARYLSIYKTWASYKPETTGVLVAYASIYGGTARAAQLLARTLTDLGIQEVAVMDLCVCDQSEAVAQAFRFSHLIVAAPTYDATLYPAMHDFLYHLQIKGYRDRTVGVIENGSWAPTAGRIMTKMLSEMKNIDIVTPVVTIHSQLNSKSIESIQQMAKDICNSIH